MRYLSLLVPFLALFFAACNAAEEQPQATPTPSPPVAQPSPTPEPTPTATPAPVQRIAYIGTDGDVWVINADGSGQQKLFDVPAEAGDIIPNLHWAPDGGKFAIASRGIVYIVSTDGKSILEVPAFAFLAWAAGSDVFAVARQAGGPLAVLDLKGETIVELPSEGFAASSFSADGRRYAYLDPVEEGGICGKLLGVVADVRTGETRPIDPDEEPTECGVGTPIFSPTNPSLLAYGDRIFDLTTDEQRSLPGRAISWSPDGVHLLVIGERAHLFDVEKGAPVLEFDIDLLGIDVPVADAQSAWSSDSQLLATSDAIHGSERPEIHIRDIPTGGDEAVAVPEHVSMLGAFFLQFSPDGQHLLFSSSLTTSRDDPNHRWFVMDVDGSNLIQLAEGRWAAWQPQP